MLLLSTITIIIILYFLCRTFLAKSVSFSNATYLFNFAFIISVSTVVAYHLIGTHILELYWAGDIPGVLSLDGSCYHEHASIIAKNNFIKHNYSYGDKAVVWQYIIAIPYYVFGNYPIFAKLINAALFASSSIFVYAIALHQSRSPILAKKSYYLFLFFLPLLIHYNGSLLKESLLASITIVNIYLYQLINDNPKIKHFIFFFIGFAFMFLTRYQYSVILIFSMCSGIILGNSNLSNRTKISCVVILCSTFLIIFQLISQTQLTFIENFGVTSKTLRTSANVRMVVEGTYLDYILEFFKNPILFGRQIVYGIIMIIFHPFPWQIINPTRTVYAIWAAYNFFFYICIPFIGFGLIYKNKMIKFNHIDYTILLYWISCLMAITLNGRDPFRYRVSFFPLLLLYVPYGSYYYSKWKAKIPLLLVIMIIILFVGSEINFYELTGVR